MAMEIFLLLALTVIYFVIPYGERHGDEESLPGRRERDPNPVERAPAARERSWKHFYRSDSYGNNVSGRL